MSGWLKDIKDSDKVALLILYSGITICFFATLAYLGVVFHPSVTEAASDRAMDAIKDFFGVGGGLVTGATLALKLQPRQNGTPPPPEIKP